MPKYKTALLFLLLLYLNAGRLDASQQLYLDDIKSLEFLDSNGLSFTKLIDPSARHSQNLYEFQNNVAFRSMREILSKDIGEYDEFVEKRIPEYLKYTSAFPRSWLSSPKTRMELVGIVLRPDRRIQRQDTCGELRLVYRLRYDIDGKQQSRLPMTAMIVYSVANRKDCRESWRTISAKLSTNGKEQLGALQTLTSGPYEQIEVNLQISRLPQVSEVSPLEQGHYLLRIFKREASGRLQPVPLENTIDFERVRKNPFLKQDLKKWISDRQNLKSIDKGSFQIPEKFLGERSISVAPYGLNRKINKTFSSLFSPKDFASLDFSANSLIRNSSSLLRRLDTMTCAGCHQSRSVAGFHFLGAPEPPKQVFNALGIPFSNHFSEIQPWRESFAKEPDAAYNIPFSERPSSRLGKIGEHCNYAKEHGEWKCEAGLRCFNAFPESSDGEIGTCQVAGLPGIIGQPCDWARIDSHIDPFKDTLDTLKKLPCGEKGICATGANGFASGICFETCPNGKTRDGAACLAGPVLSEFTPCLNKGNSFEHCLRNHSVPAQFQKCSCDQPCRDDFICARFSANPVQTACLPPYTVPQLIIEFHPSF